MIDLENYSTVIDDDGIDLIRYVKNNKMNDEIKDMISHLKEKSVFKIKFEKLDDKLVKELNDIWEDYVHKFHRDNFMEFEDCG